MLGADTTPFNIIILKDSRLPGYAMSAGSLQHLSGALEGNIRATLPSSTEEVQYRPLFIR